jgi:hypothetical protein
MPEFTEINANTGAPLREKTGEQGIDAGPSIRGARRGSATGRTRGVWLAHGARR